MTNPVIKVENLSKYYRLGVIGGGTLREDLSRWWAQKRDRQDPYAKIGDDANPQPRGGQVWALKDINLEVNEGEILGIIGRNGAGKSTLLKILSRITAPTSGRVVIKGRVGSLLEVGTGFHPELTGRENIYLNGAILGMRRAEVSRKLEEIVEFAEVAKFVDTPVKRYSSGMMVRLAFAVAAHLEPEILIVDEVLAVGDVEFQRKCLGKMQNVARQGRTILFVSHNMVTVQSLCKKVCIVSSGKIMDFDEPESVINKYLNAYAETGAYKIENRKDRTGNGLFKFTDINFKTENGTRLESLLTGQNVKIVMYYHASQSLRNLLVAVNFYEYEGYVLTNVNNINSGCTINVEAGHGQIICQIDKFPLRAGIFYSNLYCASYGSGGGSDLLDWVQGAFKVCVEDGDFYRTGRALGQGKFFVESRWESA